MEIDILNQDMSLRMIGLNKNNAEASVLHATQVQLGNSADKVSISMQTGDLHKKIEDVKKSISSDISDNSIRIADIKEAIESGSYQIDISTLAESILGFYENFSEGL